MRACERAASPRGPRARARSCGVAPLAIPPPATNAAAGRSGAPSYVEDEGEEEVVDGEGERRHYQPVWGGLQVEEDVDQCDAPEAAEGDGEPAECRGA